jgi:uncharacterized protein YciI
MYFLMVCNHHEGGDIAARRDAVRPRHREWVGSGGNGVAKVLTGSAIWNDAGEGVGNFGILEAASEADARAFAEGDPFFTQGIVREYQLTRLADGFRAERIQPLTA